jgi:hypothetical protein
MPLPFQRQHEHETGMYEENQNRPSNQACQAEGTKMIYSVKVHYVPEKDKKDRAGTQEI